MKSIFYLGCLSLAASACVSVPKNSPATAEKISTLAGPEDLLVDSIAGFGTRLLISCNDHRAREKAKEGEILYLDLLQAQPQAQTFERVGEPEGLDFHPHGFYLNKEADQKSYLYIISHDDLRKVQSVYKYELGEKQLIFNRQYQHQLFHSPNSVVSLPDGSFYISNDIKKRGRVRDAFFKLKTGSVVYCDANGSCDYAVKRLGYANGLCLAGEKRLLVGTTSAGQMLAFDIAEKGKLGNKTLITKSKGADNIRMYGETNTAFMAAHLRFAKFFFHLKNPKKLSPTVIYQVDIAQKSKKVAYANKGKAISAAATALYYNGYLYVGQVFEPFIVRVPYELK